MIHVSNQLGHTFTLTENEYNKLLNGEEIFCISQSSKWEKAKFTLSFKGVKKPVLVRGKMAREDDVFTYAVVDADGNLVREFFESKDAQKYATKNGYLASGIVSLCNGLSEDEMH